jgi:hypothetical protein
VAIALELCWKYRDELRNKRNMQHVIPIAET